MQAASLRKLSWPERTLFCRDARGLCHFNSPVPLGFYLDFHIVGPRSYSEHVTQKDLVDCSWRSYAPTSWRIPVDRLYYTENKQNKVPKFLLTFEQKLLRSLLQEP
jgi:hypothetical protein